MGGSVSTFKQRLWIILTFGAAIVLAVAATRAFPPDNHVWAALLPWLLLALFWLYLAVMIRRDRRRGRAD